MPSQLQGLAAWLLTYALHSTLLLGLAWMVTRSRRVGPTATDIIWKSALLGGIVSATAQGALALRPPGTLAMTRIEAQVSPSDPSPSDPSPAASDARTSLEATPAAVEHENPGVSGAGQVPALPGASLDVSGSPAPATSFDIPPVPVLLAFGWLVIATLLVVGYAARRLVLLGRLGDRRLVGDSRITGLLDTLRDETGVSEPVRLTSSVAISSPVALGREICLPAAALDELDAEQQRAMLAHELAHIVRRDPQWLALTCVLERALFFQPLNRLARRGIQSSAEYLADEWAARRAGGMPLAKALVKVAEWMQASPLGVPVAGFAEERSQLTVRVARLLDRTAWARPASRWMVSALAAAALLVTTAFAPGVSSGSITVKGDGSVHEATPSGVTLEDAAEAKDEVAPESRARSEAPRQVAQSDTSVVRAVIERLRDEDAEVRRAAAYALGRLKDPMAIGPLVRALEDEDEEVRDAALSALDNFERGVPAPPIRGLLGSPSAETRSSAIRMLANMKDRASIPGITQLTADPDADVRQCALEALDELDAPVADAIVGRALEDRSPDVRQTATHMAGERRLVSLVPALISMLEDTNGNVRESAAEALTEMRTDASHRALRLAITHRDAKVRRIAVSYLGEEDDR